MGFFDPGAGLFAGLISGSPSVPKFNEIDPQKEQKAAIEGNIDALPEAQKLAGGVNAFNQEQLLKMASASIPQFDALKSQGTNNLMSWLKGEIPADVSDAIMRSTAGKSLAGGFAGGGMARNLTARDLGLTSLDIMGKGMTTAQSWMQTMNSLTTPGLFNVGSMFLSPETQIQHKVNERNTKFQRDWTKNVIDWQSSPGYLIGNEINQGSAQMNTMIGSAAGSVAGGGGGGGY